MTFFRVCSFLKFKPLNSSSSVCSTCLIFSNIDILICVWKLGLRLTHAQKIGLYGFIGEINLKLQWVTKKWRIFRKFSEFWKNMKKFISVQLLNGFIPSHKESPNFWHVNSQLRTTLYWNHIVPDRQGSAAHEIPNHWISPTQTPPQIIFCKNCGHPSLIKFIYFWSDSISIWKFENISNITYLGVNQITDCSAGKLF